MKLYRFFAIIIINILQKEHTKIYLNRTLIFMFNKRLKELRELRGLTQKEMAEMLHIAPTTYRNYENTLREPGFTLLVKIAQVLNTSTDYLLGNSVCEKKKKPFSQS